MTLNEDIERLSRVALLEGFPGEQLRLIAFGSKRIFKRAGEEIYREGAVSDGGYIIVNGQVDLLVDRGQRQMVLASYLDNSLIGEISLITENRRIATAMARTNVELLMIPRELFKRMLSEYPQLAQLLHERISISVRRMVADMAKVHAQLQDIPDLARQSGHPDVTGENF